MSSFELTRYQGDCTVDLLETFPASLSPAPGKQCCTLDFLASSFCLSLAQVMPFLQHPHHGAAGSLTTLQATWGFQSLEAKEWAI